MAFRNLFLKPREVSVDDAPATAPDGLPLAAAPGYELVPDDGPIHLPHRGLPPFKPQTAKVDEPLHIPYRGLAPFRPGGVAQSTQKIAEDTALDPAPTVVRSHETRSASEAVANPPAIKRTVEKLAPPREEVRDKPREGKRGVKPRVPRHSSGWAAMLKHLKEEQSLRVLDIGPTSPNNINFLTGMGHSVYMADIVQEAIEGGWTRPAPEEQEEFDVEGFCEQNFNFHDRRFDVVLLWSTIDYLPDALIPAVIGRIHKSMEPGGQLLAFFHTRDVGPNTTFCRYHLVDSSDIDLQENAPYTVLHVHTNREIERLFKDFSGCRFFLARDNVYEVIVTR